MTTENQTETKTERSKRHFLKIGVIIGAVIILVGCGYVLGQITLAVGIILFSAFLVFILRVPVAWMERKRIPRAWGVIISYLGLSIIITLIILIFLPIITDQIVEFTASLPGYVSDIRASWDAFYEQYANVLEDTLVQQIVQSVTTELSSLATMLAQESVNRIVSLSTSLVNALIIAGLSLIVGFWVLKDLPRIGSELLIISGPRFSGELQYIARSFSWAIGGYLKGMVISGVCVGTMVGICYYIIGLPYPALLGLLTGLMNFIPFLGPWIAGITVALLGFHISPVTAFLAIALTISCQTLVDNLVMPRVMSGAVDLHPSVVIVALMAGGAVGGILGILCAIPLTAAIKTLFVHYFERKTGRKLGSQEGALFKTRQEMKKRKKGSAEKALSAKENATDGIEVSSDATEAAEDAAEDITEAAEDVAVDNTEATEAVSVVDGIVEDVAVDNTEAAEDAAVDDTERDTDTAVVQ